MKVLMISGDKNILSEGSEAYARLQLQKSSVEQLDVFVWPQVHSCREISLAAKRNKYDVITAQDPFWRGLLAWRIARSTGTKLNVQVHTDLSAQSFMRHILAQIVLRHADSVRVVSEEIKQQVLRIGVCAPVHVLPVFVDIESYKNIIRQPHSDKKILWLGRFEGEKDPIGGISVFTEVLTEIPDVKLLMLGSGSLEHSLRTKAEKLPVEFLGWRLDPKPYLAMVDVVLCTSRHESFGASIVEALAAGVPVVAPDVGIVKEAGAIVVPREKMKSALIEVLRSGVRGELKLKLLNSHEWVQHWKESLV